MDHSLPTHDDLSHLHVRWGRERAFHDKLATQLDPASLPAGDVGRYDEVVLAAAEIATGTRVLDLGCGQGDMTLVLLACGATVTSLDLSPGMIELARRRVDLYANGRIAALVAAPVECTGLPSESFDVIVGRWILHHVDLRSAASELARIMAPGGRAVFFENSGANPALTLARNHVAGRFGVPRIGTKDERPLVADDWQVLGDSFPRVRSEFPIFEMFELFNRQVFRYRSRRVGRLCRALDDGIGRTWLRKYSYRVLVVVEK